MSMMISNLESMLSIAEAQGRRAQQAKQSQGAGGCESSSNGCDPGQQPQAQQQQRVPATPEAQSGARQFANAQDQQSAQTIGDNGRCCCGQPSAQQVQPSTGLKEEQAGQEQQRDASAAQAQQRQANACAQPAQQQHGVESPNAAAPSRGLNREQFLRDMQGKEVSVGALKEDPRVSSQQAERIARADLDGDGKISGKREMNALWNALDDGDRDGSRNTMSADSEGGKAAAAVAQNAKKNNDTTLQRADFDRAMQGKEVSLGALKEDPRVSSEAFKRIQKADLDGDGKIGGAREQRALWNALDDKDFDGSRDSMWGSKNGTATEAANVLDAARTNARPSAVRGDVRTDEPQGPRNTRDPRATQQTEQPQGTRETQQTQPTQQSPRGDGSYPVQAQYRPGSPEQVALFQEAARRAGLPESWASSPGLQNILRRESNGQVGRPNYTYGARARDPSQWGSIHNELKNGRITARSSATGLGQLLLSNVDKYYPDGRQGIGNPMSEAIGMMRYIKDRYGSPERAWQLYGVRHEGY